jgi:ribosomal protein L11 methyltransferase
VLAIAAAKLLHKRILATDIDPRATRVAAANAKLNGVAAQIHAIRADGWVDKTIRRNGPYDLILANILAWPHHPESRGWENAELLGGRDPVDLALHRAQQG